MNINSLGVANPYIYLNIRGSLDIKGPIPPPRFNVSIWMDSTIEPDNLPLPSPSSSSGFHP